MYPNNCKLYSVNGSKLHYTRCGEYKKPRAPYPKLNGIVLYQLRNVGEHLDGIRPSFFCLLNVPLL